MGGQWNRGKVGQKDNIIHDTQLQARLLLSTFSLYCVHCFAKNYFPLAVTWE